MTDKDVTMTEYVTMIESFQLMDIDQDDGFSEQKEAAGSAGFDDQHEARQREMEELRKKIKDREEQNRRARERRKREAARNRNVQRQLPKKKLEKESSGGEWRKGEQHNISDAVLLVGTCQMMCPQAEIDERSIQKDFSIFETSNAIFDPKLAVKKYRRSAALCEQAVPEDVRPPEVLLRTMDHLKRICDTKADLTQIHHFVRDRTRSLRQDSTLQGLKDDACIRIHEESVRFHILSGHRLCGSPVQDFSAIQNREQLDKCLISLREMYDWRQEQKLPMSANEPEMQSYYVLTHMTEPKKCVQLLSGFAPEVRQTVAVRFAFKVVCAASKTCGNPATFFACVREAPYLTACLLHPLFSTVRANAISMMNHSYGMRRSLDKVGLSTMTSRLGFESDDEAVAFFKMFKLQITGDRNSEHIMFPSQTRFNSEQVLDVCSKWKARPAVLRIETKAKGLRPSTIISGEKGVAWNESTSSTAYPKDIPSSFRSGLDERFVRRLDLRPPSPGLPGKVKVMANVNLANVNQAKVCKEVSLVQPTGTCVRKGRNTAGQVAKSGERTVIGNGEKFALFSRKRTFCQLYEPTAPTQTTVSPGIIATLISKTEVRLSDVFYEAVSLPENQPRAPKRFKTMNPRQPANNQNQLPNTFNFKQPPTTNTFPSPSTTENQPSSINVQLQTTSNFIPPPTANMFPSPPNPEVKNQPKSKIAHSISESQAGDRKILSPTPATSVHSSVCEKIWGPGVSNILSQKAMIDSGHQHAPSENDTSDVVSNDINGETTDGSTSRMKQFINEIGKRISQTEKNLNKMRKRTDMSVDVYALEHGECIRLFDCIREVTRRADTGLQRLRRLGGNGETPNQILFTKARSMLVPSLRQASMQWDEVEYLFVQSVPQLRTVKLKLTQILDKDEGSMLDALEPIHGLDLDKPALLKEMRIGRHAPSGTYRCPPPRLNELTDIAIQVIKGNVRCWQTSIINISDMRATVANRWVQVRLTGSFNEASGNEVLKRLELEPEATDRYVSVMSSSEPGDISITTNTVVATIDVSNDDDENKKSLTRLRETTDSLKDGSEETGTQTPSVIVVYIDQTTNNQLSFDVQLQMELNRIINEGSVDVVDVVKLGRDEVALFKMNASFRNDLLANVLRRRRWEYRKGLSLQNINVFGQLVARADFAWKKVMVECNPTANPDNVNMQIINSINEAWFDVRLKIKEQEARWPTEIKRRKELSDLQESIEHLKLPSPQELNVDSTGEYIQQMIAKLGKVNGVDKVQELKLDDDEMEGHAVWQFCLALRTLIPAFIKDSMGDAHTKMVVPLTVGRLFVEELNFRKRVENEFEQQDRRYVGVLKAKARTSAGSGGQALGCSGESVASHQSLKRSMSERDNCVEDGDGVTQEPDRKRIRLPWARLSWRGGWRPGARPWARLRNSCCQAMRRLRDRFYRNTVN